MIHIGQFHRSAALIASMLLAGFGAHAANDFTVQNGSWVIPTEIDGQPGRGMSIDVQDGLLVLAVYNYKSSGESTFHLASGPITGSHFSGQLNQYKNGRYYGSGPMDAVADGNAGTVQLDFDSAYTGTIQFPGEPPAAISRFNFDMIPASMLTRPETTGEQWLVAELDDEDKPVNAMLFNTAVTGFSPGPMNVPALSDVQSFLDGDASFVTCSYNGSTLPFKCNIKFDRTGQTRTLEFTKHLESMSGTMSYLEGNFSPAVPGKHRVVGMRLAIAYYPAIDGMQVDAPSSSATAPMVFSVTPDPGSWIITSELTGAPGRGMAIDVQYNTLVMPVYNYKESGAATFNLLNAGYGGSIGVGQLKNYAGGRYFGGPALSGHEVPPDVGQTILHFPTPTKGTIQFPSEPSVAIQRYQFSSAGTRTETLYGGWMIFDPKINQLRYYTLNSTDSHAPDIATGTGAMLSIRCQYTDSAVEAVLCRDQTFVSIDDYRFTPVSGRAVGSHEPSGNPIYVLRIKDRLGNLAGLGRF